MTRGLTKPWPVASVLLFSLYAQTALADDDEIPSLEFLSFVGEFTDDNGEPVDFEILQDDKLKTREEADNAPDKRAAAKPDSSQAAQEDGND